MLCPNCGFESPAEMRFCGRCGAHLRQLCPACGFANPLDYYFCGLCGSLLPQAEPFPPPRAPDEVNAPSLPPSDRPPSEGAPSLSPSDSMTSNGAAPPLQASAAVPPPARPTIRLEGGRRQATVLLADVFGSTDLLEQIGTEAWVDWMNRMLQTLEAEVYRYGGQVDQFRGDGLVAFFGAPVAHEDDPERAVLAALAMQDAIRADADDLRQQTGFQLRLRVGISTGEVIVTSIGNRRPDRRHEDTAMGEAVTLAARLEQAAEPDTVLVDDATYRQVATCFHWQPLGQVMLKGLSQSVTVFRPLAHRERTGEGADLRSHGLSAPLIGRDAEFRLLESRIHDLDQGRGGIIIVGGDEGLGKSYLVNEVRRHIFRDRALRDDALEEGRGSRGAGEQGREDSPLAPDFPAPLPSSSPAPLLWLQGRCRSYDQSSPYHMWADLLRNWLSIPEGEPADATRERLYQHTEALWGDRLTAYYPYLAAFLSLPLEDPYADRVSQLDADGLRQQFFWTIRAWIEALSQRGPLVLVFSDMHWADASSLALLEYCLPLCDFEPVLWLLIFRPQRSSAAWNFRYRVETEFPHRLDILTLKPLTEAESAELIDRLVGPETLPPETRTLILNQAEGIPYYIEELLYVLIEQGVILRDESTGQWRRGEKSSDGKSPGEKTPHFEMELPATLQSLLLARLDSLPVEQRRLLQMAAVIGVTFWSNALQALYYYDPTGIGPAGATSVASATSVAPTDVRSMLNALQRAQFVTERGQVPDLGMEYSFRSKLTRDVAYLSILSRQRAVYHHQLADYLEQQAGQVAPPQYYGMLAYHYRQAGVPGKELYYTHLAAQQAARIYANAEALFLCNRALALLDEMEADAADAPRLYTLRAQRFEILNERRALYQRTGDYAAALADARALLPLAQLLGDDPAWLIDALLQQPGVAHWTTGREELQNGLALAEQALALAQQTGDCFREMHCLLTISLQRHALNDPAWSEAGEQALTLARQFNDRRFQVRVLAQMGSAYSWSDEPERGMAYLEAALPICRELDDRITEVDLLSRLGLQAERLGDYYRLLVDYQRQALHISREIGYRRGEDVALLTCGQTQAIYLGDYDGGWALLEQACLMREGLPEEAFPILRQAQILMMRGQTAEARLLLERARATRPPDMSFTVGQAGLYLVAAALHNALADLSAVGAGDAQPNLHQALELAAQVGRLIAESPVLSRQYEVAAACQASLAHLNLAHIAADEAERHTARQAALHMSQSALAAYEALGFLQIIECVSEEILFRHSQALDANGRDAEAADFRRRAHHEMMRKHDLIPHNSPFRRTFLDNIPLHRDIQAAMPPTTDH